MNGKSFNLISVAYRLDTALISTVTGRLQWRRIPRFTMFPNIHPTTVAPLLDHRRNVNTLYPMAMAAWSPHHPVSMGPRMRHQHAMWARGQKSPPSAKSPAPAFSPTAFSLIGYRSSPNLCSDPLLFWPNGVNKCRIECWTIAPDWGDGEGPDYWTVNRGESLCKILLEDTEFGTEIQKSMESPGFKGVPLAIRKPEFIIGTNRPIV